MPTLVEQEEARRKATEQRYQQAMSLYDEIIARMQPGGAFEKASLAQLERTKAKTIGAETQQLISSGLYGTTTMGGVGRRFESDVGMPTRLKLEDLQQQRLSEAQLAKAGFIERVEDVGPDYGLIAQLAQQAGMLSGIPRTTKRTYGGTYGASSFPDQFSITNAPSSRYTGKTITGTKAGTKATTETATPTITPTTRGEYGTYYGAAAPIGTSDMAAYNAWAAEMKRRYPSKPVMPYSRWQTRVKPKMGSTYQQFATGTYQASTP